MFNKGTLVSRDLRPQDLLVLQGTLQGRLHLHVAELGDGKVQVLQEQLGDIVSNSTRKDIPCFCPVP